MPSRPNAQNSSAMLPPCAFIPFADDVHATLRNPMHDPTRSIIPVVILFLFSKFVGIMVYNGQSRRSVSIAVIPRLVSSLVIQPAVIITHFCFRSHACLVPSNSRHRSRSR